MDPLQIGLSGIRSAEVRLAASAHNVANLTTPGFRPLRTVQSAQDGGGSQARADPAPTPEPVDLAGEFVEQTLAKVQLEASARVLDVHVQTTGSLVDLLA